MAKILLSVPVEVTVVNGKKKETIKADLRDMTKKEVRELREALEKYQELNYRIESIAMKLESAKKKNSYAEKMGDFKAAMKYQEAADALQKDLDDLVKKIKKMGGEDFPEVQAKKNFNRLVSGEGKERLKEIAEAQGYEFVMQKLAEAKVDAEGKLQGE